MTRQGTYHLPEGLPIRFAKPEDGFTLLCEFLDIANRHDKQKIVNIDGVRRAVRSRKTSVRNLSTSERLQVQLTTFYSLPDERRKLWRYILKGIPNTTREFPSDVPSLEYQAFKSYKSEFLEQELDEAIVGESLADFPRLFESISDSPEWQRPALAVWIDLRCDLLQWATLSPSRRDAVAVATFAVATILDDVRFLEWAAGRAETLAGEYAFALAENPGDAEATPVQQEERNRPAEDETGEAVRKWNEACVAIVDMASTLGGEYPKPERLDELIEQVHALEDLREPLAVVLDVQRSERLVERVTRAVAAMAGEDGVSWLDQYTGKILAQWKLFYIAPGNVDVEQFRQDVERVERELGRAVTAWRTIEHAKQSSQQRLQEVEASAHGLGDLLSIDDRKVELQEEVTRATRKLRDARRHLFQVIGPQDQEFDPSTDYERECNDAGVFRVDHTHEDTVQEPVERPDRESNEEVAKATTLPPEAKGVHEVNEKPPAVINDDRQRTVDPDGLLSNREGMVVGEVTSEPPDTDADSPAAALPPATGESRSVQSSSYVAEPVAAEGADDVVAVEPSSEPGHQYATAVAVLWQSIDVGRLGIAYHIAKLLAERGDDEQVIPPADLIAALALADHVQSADDEVARALRPFLDHIDPGRLTRDNSRDQDAINLLLFSAALRPALFASSMGAASMLRRINTPKVLAPVYELATKVAHHADRLQGIRLDAALIKATLSGAVWQKEFETFVARVDDWRNRAESRRNLFHRAHLVWNDLLSGNGRLAELVEMLSRDNAADREKIETIREEICVQKSFNDLVQKTDRRGRKSNPIQGRALRQLWDHVQPAIGLSSEWLRLMAVKPDPKGFVAQRIEELRRDLIRHGHRAVTAIEGVPAKEGPGPLAAARRHARNTVEALLQIFDDDAPSTQVVDESPDVIRSRDLLYVTGLNLDMEFRPSADHSATDMLDLLQDTAAHAETLSEAFDARLSRGDLTGAQLVCDGLDAKDDPEADRCRASLDREVQRQRRELKKTHADEEGHLERAFCLGQLGIDERDELAARLVSLKRFVQPVSSSESPLNVADAVASAKSELAHIQQSIETSRAARINEAKTRFETAVPTNPEVEGWPIVGQAIESGDILIANELMSRLENGESVDIPTVTDDSFQEFMSAVEEIDQAVDAPEGLQAQVVVRRAAAREHIAGVSFENLSKEEAAQAASLLKAWYTLSRVRRVEEPALRGLLQQLGFKVRSISIKSGRGWPQADVVTETIEDRVLCPSRQFGSEARGHYRVLLNWERPAHESIVESLGVKGGAPTVVLHFGSLGDVREKLRTLAVRTHRLFLVVDESLILFLAARPSGRLSTLFRSTLPFTSVDPYATTSSLVPPELFYGREREQREITDPSGACFIYGGRQLGKTALLRRVERDFKRSGETNLAKWIDLKVNEIGYARGPRDIWSLLQRELGKLSVVRKRSRELDPENRRQVNSLLDQIRQWIDERENRRLLLLLDEADAFLEQDARTEFRESARLKGLMDETERRFKVVFAGLHNVLRTTRQANHPLAHFGDPIRVGAMLSNGEWRQAQALVREPLQAIGCQFERDELSTRILAQTNYYPSLIQLYGAELVRRLRDSNKTFPYAIDDDAVNAAYNSQELGSAIRERFLLTLQLDQRYEVIAYALTQEFHGEADLGQGLDQDTIAEAARAWWPEGFKVTDVEFSMLLHEMEGLGVLRSVDQGRRYTLRNPNILLLLGNSDDLEKALKKERQPPTVYEPASFRARYPGNHLSSKRRGPLTYQQESALRAKGGVAVISGCNAAGLEHVAEFLQQRIGSELFRTLQSVSDSDEFEQELRNLQPVRNMVTVCLVPLTANWNPSWVMAANRVLRKKAGGRQMWSKVVFTATPEMLWQMLAGESDLRDTDWIEIGPWDERFLRHWLEDINFTADADHVNELMAVSGGWPAVLDKFGEKPPRKSWPKRIDELNRELLKDRTMQGFGVYSEEIEQVLRTLLSWTDTDNVFDMDIIEIVSDEAGLDGAGVSRRVKWSERLGLVSPAGEGCWTFNPLVTRLLKTSDPA